VPAINGADKGSTTRELAALLRRDGARVRSKRRSSWDFGFARAVQRVYRCQAKEHRRRDAGITMSDAGRGNQIMSEMLLFSPLTIRGVELRNRIVVPPMHQYSAVKGFPTDWHLMNAGKFAAGGAGLVVVESTKVERRGCGTVGDLGIWDDKFVEPLKRLVRFIKQQNSAAGIQLGHSGRKARARRPWEGDGPLPRTPEIDDWDAWTPVAPSAIAHSEKWPVPKALERFEVKDLVQAWGHAAQRAREAGFDVLELHGAHGYLVHEFLSERSNQRTDEYGGSELNRMRFVTEIVEAVRAHWPDDKPLLVRLSVEDNAGWGPEQSARLAKILKGKGVDVIDCSSGGITDAAPILGKEIKYSYQVPLSEYVRRHADIMTMAVGLIIHGDQAEQILRDGQADLIAVGREILNNPNWPMDAALKLGVEGPFRNVPPQFGYWLGTRAKRGFGTKPSTWQNGLHDPGKVS
jgi:2,4-dienoyl-CoA reductase-like NADH-dependent reductase (Old Yellow Enzyme family)